MQRPQGTCGRRTRPRCPACLRQKPILNCADSYTDRLPLHRPWEAFAAATRHLWEENEAALSSMPEAEAYAEAAASTSDGQMRDFVLGLLQLLADQDCFEDASILLLCTADVRTVL